MEPIMRNCRQCGTLFPLRKLTSKATLCQDCLWAPAGSPTGSIQVSTPEADQRRRSRIGSLRAGHPVDHPTDPTLSVCSTCGCLWHTLDSTCWFCNGHTTPPTYHGVTEDHQCRFTDSTELVVTDDSNLNSDPVTVLRRCRRCGQAWQLTLTIIDLAPIPPDELVPRYAR